MTWRNLLTLALTTASVALAASAFAAKKQDVHPDETAVALKYLLGIADQVIPPTSSCGGSDEEPVRRRMKDFIAMELSYLVLGENRITGNCAVGRDRKCRVSISHANGEDVSSADVTFVVKGGRVDISSLRCVLTP
jgi:hypothetical protein